MAREHMIAEQNAAYEESLQADREKMKRKEEQRRQEEEERQEKEAIRQSMASVVPPEPAPDCLEKTSSSQNKTPRRQPSTEEIPSQGNTVSQVRPSASLLAVEFLTPSLSVIPAFSVAILYRTYVGGYHGICMTLSCS